VGWSQERPIPETRQAWSAHDSMARGIHTRLDRTGRLVTDGQSSHQRRVKIHRNYTVDEAAKTLGVHKNTVRLWIKQGLPTVDERRPILLQGKAIRAFLDNRKAKRKCRLSAGEFYCLKCRSPKSPAGRMADMSP
jgi:hypothetical protein